MLNEREYGLMVRAGWDAVYAARAAGSEFREVEAAVSLALLTVLRAGHLRRAQACRLRWGQHRTPRGRHRDRAHPGCPAVQAAAEGTRRAVDVIDRSVYGAEHVLVSRKRHPLLVRTMTRRVQELARRAGISAWRELSADYIRPARQKSPCFYVTRRLRQRLRDASRSGEGLTLTSADVDALVSPGAVFGKVLCIDCGECDRTGAARRRTVAAVRTVRGAALVRGKDSVVPWTRPTEE